MKILIDMNIPRKYTDLLLRKGIESVRWSEVGSLNASDAEIITYGQMNNFIILTCDLDFSAILSATRGLKPSIVQVRASILHADKIVDLLTIALLQNADELEKGAILSIDAKKARLRLLPL